MGGLFEIVPGNIELSALTESGIGAEMAAATASTAAALTTVAPMAADADSIAFAAALSATGAAYLGSVAEHVDQRTAYADTQHLAAATTVAVEAANAAASAF